MIDEINGVPLTIGDIRKAMAGLPDNMLVKVNCFGEESYNCKEFNVINAFKDQYDDYFVIYPDV